jgi:hypothetical protein
MPKTREGGREGGRAGGREGGREGGKATHTMPSSVTRMKEPEMIPGRT